MLNKFSCDSHVHVYGDASYPFTTNLRFRPHPFQMGNATQFRAVLDAHGLTHGLLVAAQPYGYDNRCMLNAIAASDGTFKGIALLDPSLSEIELSDLADRGIVGFRVNLMSFGLRELTEPGAERLLSIARSFGWFVQIHYQKDEILAALPILQKSGVRIMLDHFGRPDVGLGLDQPGFQALLELGRSGNAVVKLSGPFRSSVAGYPYHDVDPFIAAAVDAFTLDHCVWGSDWPFVPADEHIDYGPTYACLARWFPDMAARRKILWDNPARLFGFSQ